MEKKTACKSFLTKKGAKKGSLFCFLTFLNLLFFAIQIVAVFLSTSPFVQLILFVIVLLESFSFPLRVNCSLLKKYCRLFLLFFALFVVAVVTGKEGRFLIRLVFIDIYQSGINSGLLLFLKLSTLFYCSSFYFIRLTKDHAMQGAVWLFTPFQLLGIKRQEVAYIFWAAYQIFPEIYPLVRTGLKYGFSSLEQELHNLVGAVQSNVGMDVGSTLVSLPRFLLSIFGEIVIAVLFFTAVKL